jgi:hypothetical protein
VLRLDGYIRVSRADGRDGEGYISPDVQLDAIKGYAKELGGRIIAWQDDQDFGGFRSTGIEQGKVHCKTKIRRVRWVTAA